MKLLLDTHIAIWTIINSEKLPKHIIDDIENYDNEIFVSMASVWEIAIKSAKSGGKIDLNEKSFVEYITKMDFNILPIKLRHISNIRSLRVKDEEVIHKDPFDRMLISQAETEEMMLYTKDEKIANYKSKNIRIID